jgi:ABC-type Fe3+/spermidine/putrescine transport system ATPase subunit
MGQLELKQLSIGYGRRQVVQNLSLTVENGEMFSLLGPSGAGKTTLLKAVAGLIRPESGEILIDGTASQELSPQRRDVVMVFQNPLLFPFLNVWENVAFGLRMRGNVGAAEKRQIEKILALTQIEELKHRRVHQLSGGQQQRVSLARSLVLQPAILLLDEPLSNLDATLRQQMRALIADIQAETRITTLFVTHDQTEALMMADRVALLLACRLRQVGSPRELYFRPRDLEVAKFFGGANFFSGPVHDGRLSCALGQLRLPGRVKGNGYLRTATIRPEDVLLDPAGIHGFSGQIRKISFEGGATRAWVDCSGTTITALTQDSGLKAGQPVGVGFPSDKIWVFPIENERLK